MHKKRKGKTNENEYLDKNKSKNKWKKRLGIRTGQTMQGYTNKQK